MNHTISIMEEAFFWTICDYDFLKKIGKIKYVSEANMQNKYLVFPE